MNEISGTSHNDALTGTVGDDHISGFAGNDTLSGLDGDDTIAGGTGNDTLGGGGGSDTYLVGQGEGFDKFSDTGSSGIDRVLATADNVVIGIQSGFNASSGIEEIGAGGHAGVTIAGGTGNDALDFSSTLLSGIARIEGGAGADTITGSSADDTIAGGTGNDTLGGGGGSDTYLVGQGEGFDKFSDTGSSGIDRVLATADNVVIGIQSGFNAGSGIEEIGAGGHAGVTIAGGTGNDSLDFSSTLLSGIARIEGGAGADTITGSSADDTIAGGTGNDTLGGGGGSDTYLVGQGEGFDKFSDTGSSGIDRVLATADNVVIGIQSGFNASSGIEEIGAGGHAGVTIAGGTGNDSLDFSSTLLSGIARFEGGAGADTITGSSADDTIVGGTGNDTLGGGGGSDTYLVGPGEGFDKFADTGASGTDRVLATADNVAIGIQSGFNAGSGIEEIGADGHSGVTIAGGTGNDSLDFSSTLLSGIARIEGGAGADTITGSSEGDTIVGGTGNDTLGGGGGSDTYLVGQGEGFDKFADTGASGTDRVLATADNVAIGIQSGFNAGSGIEEIGADGHSGVTIAGGTGNDTLDFSSTLLSGIGRIEGGAGADTITGSSADDTIAGGTGNDTLYGGTGSDLFVLDTLAGRDKVHGGSGGAWTDMIDLQGFSGHAISDGWTLTLDNGHSVMGTGADYIQLSADAAGKVVFSNGNEVTFDGIEKIVW